MSEEKFKWASPFDWLEERICHWEACQNWQELAFALRGLMTEVDGDNIQNVFQDDMASDGYFDPLRDDEEEDSEP